VRGVARLGALVADAVLAQVRVRAGLSGQIGQVVQSDGPKRLSASFRVVNFVSRSEAISLPRPRRGRRRCGSGREWQPGQHRRGGQRPGAEGRRRRWSARSSTLSPPRAASGRGAGRRRRRCGCGRGAARRGRTGAGRPRASAAGRLPMRLAKAVRARRRAKCGHRTSRGRCRTAPCTSTWRDRATAKQSVGGFEERSGIVRDELGEATAELARR